MRTCINGKEAEWPAHVRAKWEAKSEGRAPGKVLDANYYTPRPFVDEYNRGSKHEGFTYTVQAPNCAGLPSVWQVQWTPEEP